MIRNIQITANYLDRGLQIEEGVFAFVADVVIKHGHAAYVDSLEVGRGGGIWNNGGHLVLNHAELVANTADDSGGGLESRSASLTEPMTFVVGSVLQGNCAASASGIYNRGRLSIASSIVKDHNTTGPLGVCQADEGVVYSELGLVDISKSSLKNNVATEGALTIDQGEVLVSNSSIYNNNTGSVATTWSGSGGLSNYSGVITITNSTLANNTGHKGGAILNRAGSINVNQSTIAGNTSLGDGGGIYNGVDSGITPPALMSLSNTILESNTAATLSHDCFNDTGSAVDSKVTSLGGNVLGDSTDCGTVWLVYDKVNSQTSSLNVFQESFEAGQSYFTLLGSSIAVDAGREHYCQATDQIGESRPQDGNLDGTIGCDSGAIELPLILVPGATAEDIDADGMADTWELQYFGTLDRDGSGDFNNNAITDLQEFVNNSDPTLSTDIDQDGMLDTWEYTHFITLSRDGTGDYDGDGISDLQEHNNNTDPTRSEDTDADNMSDAWELAYFGDLTKDGSGDYDGDGVTDLNEFIQGTSPTVSGDVDLDGMPDAWEISYFGDISQSANGDYDSDNVSNLQEYVDGTDPTTPGAGVDSDMDGIPDDWEIFYFGNLNRDGSGDFDADGVSDLNEFLQGTSPLVSGDVDVDGMPDAWEIQYFGDISQPATGDYDSDGVSNLQEYLDGTNPTIPEVGVDSDADGMADAWELSYFGNLAQSAGEDYDYDSLSNFDEYVDGTDPTVRNPQAGEYAWTRMIAGDEKEYGRAVAVDSQGNVYIGGTFTSSTINFDSTGVGDVKSKIGSADGYLTKINADGSYAWTRTMSGVGGSANIASIAIDELDNVFVAGSYSGVIDFDVEGVGDIYTSTNGSNAFISKLQAYTGDYIATHTYIGSAYISDIAIGGGKLYAVGGYNGDVDFTPATVGNEYNSLYGYSIHVTQLNTDLSHGWTRVFNTSAQGAFANARAVVADPLGGVYLLGQFSGFIDLSVGGIGASYTSTLDHNGYALKLGVDGSYAWSRTVPISVDGDITLGEDDSVYIAGRYSRTVDFDPSGGGDVHTSGSNQADIYLTRVNAIDGSYVSTRVFTNNNYAEYVYAVASVGKYVLIGTKSDGRFYNSSGIDARLIATSPELPDWTYSVGTYQQDSIEDIAVAPDASVYLVGNVAFGNSAVDASVDFNRYIAPDYHQSSAYGGVFLTKRTFTSEDVCGSHSALILYQSECVDDVDGDGMPDPWEIQYFGDISQPADGDYDSDGTSNLQEYMDGTDPTVGAISVTDLIGQYEYGWVKAFGSSISSRSDYGKGRARRRACAAR